MKRIPVYLIPAAVLFAAVPAMAQTAPASSPSDDITRELNGGPPAAVQPRTVLPAPPVATPAPATSQTTQRTVTPTPAPAATQPRVEPRLQPAATPPVTRPPAVTAAPPATRPPAVTAAPTPTVPASTAASTEPVTEVPPPPPTVTVLDATAIAALPFRIDLPAGFEITTGRPAPDFKVYSVQRAGEPFVMIYAGPSAIFPIYEGDQVEAAGRASVLVTEDGRRRAVEHLFQGEGLPRQIHVWVASVEAADRDRAEAIAQSVDPR